jgi:hypothetical protein
MKLDLLKVFGFSGMAVLIAIGVLACFARHQPGWTQLHRAVVGLCIVAIVGGLMFQFRCGEWVVADRGHPENFGLLFLFLFGAPLLLLQVCLLAIVIWMSRPASTQTRAALITATSVLWILCALVVLRGCVAGM